jgi:hypothetical protein
MRIFTICSILLKKLYFISLITACSLPIVNAQTQFQRTIGGSGDDRATPIIQTSDGGYAAAGYTSSFGAGGYDEYIVKFDFNGTLQWSRTIGGTGTDIALSITQTTDGGYTVSGETNSFGAGGYDEYIVKLDHNGMPQWTKTIGGTGDDFGEHIVQTIDGGYAIGGQTNSFGAGDYDMIIVKIDAAGTFQWSRTIGGTSLDYALSIIQTTDRGYALFGSTDSFGAGYNDYYIVKLDSSGSLQWSRTIGGTGGDYGFSIIQTTDGGYAMSGTTISFGAGNLDLYIVKLDVSGLLQWSRTIGGTNHEYGYSLVQTTDVGYAVSASTASFGAGSYDAYIVKLDSSGSLQWSKTIGGANDDNFLSIIQTTDGSYAAAGSTASFGAGGYDAYIVKLDTGGNTCGNSSSPLSTVESPTSTVMSPAPTVTSPTPTVITPASTISSGGTLTLICTFTGIKPISKEIPNSYKLFQNYPNPFNPSTNIKFDIAPLFNQGRVAPASAGDGVVTLKIYDILGREVTTLVNQQLQPGTYNIEWNASDYPSGIYFYKLETGNFVDAKKMVLVK